MTPFITACPTWCLEAGAHAVDVAPCDRTHYGDRSDTVMSLQPLERFEIPVPGAESITIFQVPLLAVWLEQNTLHTAPAVHLGYVEDMGWSLTLEEAQQLGEQLLRLVADAQARS